MADNDVKIKLSLDGADDVKRGLSGVGEGAESGSNKLRGLATGALATAGKALVGLGVAAVGAGAVMGKSIVEAYAAYEQNVGGIETMFGDSSSKMMQYAQDAYKTAGLSANDYMSQATSFSAALLQGLGGDTAAAADYANKAMVDMSDNANKFGTNIGDIQNAYQGFAKNNYSMLDNLKLGYGGTAEEMARLINDSGVMGDTMQVTAETVNDVSFDKIIEAIHKTQEEMGIAGTTAEEAQSTISGSIGMLQASFQNLLVGLGDTDQDVASLAGNVLDSFSSVAENILPVIENIGTNFGSMAPMITEAIGSIVDVAVALLPVILETGTQIVLALVQGLGEALPDLITTVLPMIMTLVEGILELLPMLVDVAAQIIVALALGLAESAPTLIPTIVNTVLYMVQALLDNMPLLLDAAGQLMIGIATGLVAAIPQLLDMLPEIIDSLVSFLVGAIPQIASTGQALISAIVDNLPAIIGAIIAVIPAIIEAIANGILGGTGTVSGAGTSVMGSLSNALRSAVSGFFSITSYAASLLRNGIASGAGMISSAGASVMSSLRSALQSGISGVASVGRNIVTGIWDGLQSMAGWLLDRARSFASSIADTVKSALRIKSPSRVFADEVGAMIPAGIAVGIDANTNSALRSLDEMSDSLVKSTKATFQGLNIGDMAKTIRIDNPRQVATSLAYPMATPKMSQDEALERMLNKLMSPSDSPEVTNNYTFVTQDPSEAAAYIRAKEKIYMGVR